MAASDAPPNGLAAHQHAYIIAALFEATGAAVQEVARAIGSDSRLDPKFLKDGPGFGGSCFQKEILNLVYFCRHYGLEEVAAYWEQVVALNTWQQHRIARLVVTKLFGTVTGKRLAVLGFAFKANTNDTPRSRRVLRRSIPSDPHLPRFAGGRGRAGDRRSQAVCGANYKRRWPGA